MLMQYKDWKEVLESSDIHIIIVYKDFCEDVRCIEQVISAKQYNMPTVIAWEENAKLTIPDLFEGLNIVKILYFNQENKHIIAKQILAIMKAQKKQLKKKKKNNAYN